MERGSGEYGRGEVTAVGDRADTPVGREVGGVTSWGYGVDGGRLGEGCHLCVGKE